MNKDIYIGIDGGGSKCAIRVEDADGTLLAEAQAGPANISMSFEQAWDSIRHACYLAQIDFTREDLNVHAGMGLAGTEDVTAVQAFLDYLHPFDSIVLKSDAHIACKGAHAGEDGAIIISGTGIIGYAMQDAEEVTVSGWGFALHDVGSGAWLGYEAIRCMLKWRDQRCRSTPLLEALFERIGDDIVGFARRANATSYAEFAKVVFEYSEDPVAKHLFHIAAKEIETIYETLCKSRFQFPLCLHGSIAQHLMPYLSIGFINHLVPVEGDALEGAMSLIREEVCV